jgi:holo-[acyl-carrier protein] synthase
VAVVGIGLDLVDIDRFAESLTRTPRLRERLFTPQEACLPDHSLAARFAAKEAIAKALGAPPQLGWHDAEVVCDDTGRPHFVLRGTVLARADHLGVVGVHVTLSHDGGMAAAMVVLES